MRGGLAVVFPLDSLSLIARSSSPKSAEALTESHRSRRVRLPAPFAHQLHDMPAQLGYAFARARRSEEGAGIGGGVLAQGFQRRLDARLLFGRLQFVALGQH